MAGVLLPLRWGPHGVGAGTTHSRSWSFQAQGFLGADGRGPERARMGRGAPPLPRSFRRGGEEGCPHLGRWRLASRERRGQASGTQLRWGAGPGCGETAAGAGLRRFQPGRGHGNTAGGPPSSHIPAITVLLPSTLSRAWALIAGAGPACGPVEGRFQEDTPSQGLRGRAPKAGGPEAVIPRAGAQRPGPLGRCTEFQIPVAHTPSQSMNVEWKFS